MEFWGGAKWRYALRGQTSVFAVSFSSKCGQDAPAAKTKHQPLALFYFNCNQIQILFSTHLTFMQYVVQVNMIYVWSFLRVI